MSYQTKPRSKNACPRWALTLLAGMFAQLSMLHAQDFLSAGAMGGPRVDEARSVAVDDSGNVYAVGWYRDTADFDPGPERFQLTSAGNLDIFVTKLDPDGNLLWAGSMGGASTEQAFGVALDDSGNVYTVGFFSGTADFDPGEGVFNLTSEGSRSIFVSKLDSSGQFVWARAMGGPNTNVRKATGVAVDGAGTVHLAGRFRRTADFDPGPHISFRTSAGSTDIFMLEFATLAW